MRRLLVGVKFEGCVAVDVPDNVSESDAELLAGKLALSRILATLDNPDAPEDAACEEYIEESAAGKESDWDNCHAELVSGEWSEVRQ